VKLKSGKVKAPAGFSYWIIKFDGVHDSAVWGSSAGYGRGRKWRIIRMALAAGIEMSECRLLEKTAERPRFMTKRF